MNVPPHGPGHLRTFDYTGLYRYFLTFCCDSKAQRFLNATVVELVLAQILRAAADEQFAVPAYCFMPDHAHLLVEAKTDASNALRFISRSKQLSGFHYKQRHGHRLWQRYGYEHVLRDDEDTRRVARYILENPIRGGLVRCAKDYPFVGSCVFTLDEILEGTDTTSG
jgi:putative transposase